MPTRSLGLPALFVVACSLAACASNGRAPAAIRHLPGDGETTAPSPTRDRWLRTFCEEGYPAGCEADYAALGADGSLYVAGATVDQVQAGRGAVLSAAIRRVRIPLLVALSPDGSLRWRRALPEAIRVNDVAARPSGGVVVVGELWGSLSLDSSGESMTPVGDRDGFVAVLDGSGEVERLVALHAEHHSTARAVAVLQDGTTLVAGSWSGVVDLDPGEGTDRRAASGESAAFVLALDAAGRRLWSVVWDGDGWDAAHSLSAMGSRGVLVTGHWESGASVDDTSAGAPPSTCPGGGASGGIAVVALDAGGRCRWSRTIAESWGLAPGGPLAADGSVGLAGQFAGYVELDEDNGTVRHVMAGWAPNVVTARREGLLVRVGPDGGFRWSETYDTGPSWTTPPAGWADGTMVVGGSFEGSLDLCPGEGVDLHAARGRDAYVLGVDRDGRCLGALTLGGPESISVSEVVADPSGALIIVGDFSGEIDFDPGDGQALRSAESARDLFVLRLPARDRALWFSGRVRSSGR